METTDNIIVTVDDIPNNTHGAIGFGGFTGRILWFAHASKIIEHKGLFNNIRNFTIPYTVIHMFDESENREIRFEVRGKYFFGIGERYFIKVNRDIVEQILFEDK